MEETVFAGLDLGTSGSKGVLVTAEGRVCARAAARHPTPRPDPGSAEQGPKDWFTSFAWVTLELAQAVRAERRRAIGLSAMLPTLVLTDGTGAAATPGGAGAPYSRHPTAARWARPLSRPVRPGRWLLSSKVRNGPGLLLTRPASSGGSGGRHATRPPSRA